MMADNNDFTVGESETNKGILDISANQSQGSEVDRTEYLDLLDMLQKQCEINVETVKYYEGSFRFRAGTAFVESLSPGKIFGLPFRLYKIYKEYRHKEEGSAPTLSPQTQLSSDKMSLLEDGKRDVPCLGGGEIIRSFDSYLKYSSLIQKLYPEKFKDDALVEIYMDLYRRTLQKEYRKCAQDVLISVIMPTYNREGVIGNAIHSVIGQSYQNWELLVVDDGSTDHTEELISKIPDKRIKYLKNTGKKGCSGARNTGLKQARGELIAYLDTDNDWEEDYLLLMKNTFSQHQDYQAVYCAQNFYSVTRNRGKTSREFIRFGIFNGSILKNRNYIDLNCYMHRTKLYKQCGGFSEQINRFVDWELIHRYAQESIPYALPCKLSNYYFGRVDNQITRDDHYQESLEAFNQLTIGDKLELRTEPQLGLNYTLYSDRLNSIYNCGSRRVSVIIPNYEAIFCLKACIEALHKFTCGVEYEIIIVDNNSSPEVKNYLQELSGKDPIVKVVLNSHNMGFTYAVNQGIEMAMSGSDIILLNNDAIVTKGWIQELYRVKDSVSKVGIIAPRQVLIPGTDTMELHVPIAQTNRELDVTVSRGHRNVMDVEKYAHQGFVQLSFAPFFLVMITRECFDVLSYLDAENGRHYESDRLYCQKASSNGFKIMYTPYSKAYHLLQQSTAILKEKDKEMYQYIYEKNDWSEFEHAYDDVKDMSFKD